MSTNAPRTAVLAGSVEQFDIISLNGDTMKAAGATDQIGGQATRRVEFRAAGDNTYAASPQGTRASYHPFENGQTYECNLSADCVADQDLFVDAAGKVSPTGPGAKIGRSIGPGVAGETITFRFEVQGGSGGTGTTVAQVQTLINQNADSKTRVSNTANNTPPTDVDWGTGTPDAGDTLLLAKANDRVEIWTRTATDWGAAPTRIIAPQTADPGEPTFAVTNATAAPLTIAQIAAWQNPNDGNAQTYTGTTLPTTTGANQRVQLPDGSAAWFELTSLAPETWTPVSVPAASAAEPAADGSFPSHGIGFLTTTEGERMPIALKKVGANFAFPDDEFEITHFAVALVDANTLKVRTVADMQGREYTSITNTNGAVDTAVYWQPATKFHDSEHSNLLLGQIDPRSDQRFKFNVVRGGGTDIPSQITLTAHALPLTVSEGARMPIALSFDGATTWSIPTSSEQVTHFAVSAPDANTLDVRTVTNMRNREYTNITNIGGAVGEYIYWDAATNRHTTTEVTEFLLGQIDQRSATRFKFSNSLAGVAGPAGQETRTTELAVTTEIPAGTPINLNAATAGFTALVDSATAYTGHSSGTSVTFESLFNRVLFIDAAGEPVEQPLVSRDDADAANHVRFANTIPAGSTIVVKSLITSQTPALPAGGVIVTTLGPITEAGIVYYAGTVNGVDADWRVTRFDTTDNFVEEIAIPANNPAHTTLTAAWTNRVALTYA